MVGMTILAWLGYLAVLLLLGYLWHRALKAKDADHANWAGEARLAHTALIRAVERHARRATRAQADLEWEQLMHEVTQAERDMYQTAFRGELTRQTRAELLRPDEAAEGAVVVEFPARGAR